MKVYELIENQQGTVVKATEDEKITWIPSDPANSDYQAYLAQLEGKEPTLSEITETSEAE
jgi:hypothetical protein